MEAIDVYFFALGCALLVLMGIIVKLVVAIQRTRVEESRVEHWNPFDRCFLVCVDGHGPGGGTGRAGRD